MVTGFVVRFVAAGLMVGLLPVIAGRFGDRAAGLILLFPAVTLGGFMVQGLQRGGSALVETSLGALIGLPTVLIFLGSVHLAARARLPLGLTLVAGVTAWLVAAIVLLSWISDLGG